MASHAPAERQAVRRIAAVVLPELLCEIASTARLSVKQARNSPLTGQAKRRPCPLGVVLIDENVETHAAQAYSEAGAATETAPAQTIKPSSPLNAVNDAARRFGVREGQTIAEACALISELEIRAVQLEQVRAALGRVAEIALAFGPTVAIAAQDTVLVDVTGVAHLMGGEAALLIELASRVRAIGHVTQVAIASGPLLARAFARWSADPAVLGGERGIIVERAQTAEKFASLPLAALPLGAECSSWFVRLGVLTVGDLAALPRAASAARLGANAARILELCQGYDPEPLNAYEPPRTLVEHTTWEDGVSSVEPLLFVLRGLTSRLSARLAGRGEAAQRLRLVIEGDVATARLHQVEANIELDFELAVPLWREQELMRVIASRLERQRLQTASVGLRLEAPALTPAEGQQLDLSRVSAGLTAACPGLEQLPVLIAELSADIGKECVGVLALGDSFRPERKSTLRPALGPFKKRSKRAARPPAAGTNGGNVATGWPNAPTRLLEKPLPIDAVLRVGATLAIERQLYSIETIHFEQRLDAVEWWGPSSVARDYFRLWLARPEGGVEAIVYVDRDSGARFLHAIAD